MVVAYLEKGYSLQSAIFCDTGFEFDEMIEYIQKIKDYLKTNFSTNLVILDSSHIIEKWAFEKPIIRGKYEGRKRGFPRTLGVDYCTREAKIKPIREFVLNLSKKRFSTQMLIGYTANEVQKGRVSSLDYARAVYPLNEWGWNEQECGDFLKKRGIANPLYEHFQRTGCYMCPKQNKQSLRSLFFHYPKYWEKAKQLEAKAMELNCLNKTLKIGKSLVEYEQEFKQEGKPLFAEYDEMEYEDVCFCK
ncbi:hypothetical protein CCZ01_00945 [Helicobacter monodelphidis]|uniref:phosphoadenosine phosphosulfate reductase domain-containing protein n=1 Tax=Helicobacter sp. 15-1451 TaxID=2004995 RepID=UPI000DCB99E9|nr:phosphoadenosine phosphosulfate reductase family protein [Helicobacter sp. 15-1451]RAX59361.1 hypothetical protein CCZ01_00945 [Helicobacter sp. 15-1451]